MCERTYALIGGYYLGPTSTVSGTPHRLHQAAGGIHVAHPPLLSFPLGLGFQQMTLAVEDDDGFNAVVTVEREWR